MKSKTTYVYYAIKVENLIGAYGYFGTSQMKTKHAYNYFGVSQQKVPRWGTFMLKISECIFRSNLRNRKSQLR